MASPKTYETVSEAVNDLVRRGYTSDLSLDFEKDCLVCDDPYRELPPDDFGIDEIYRFEGMTDPGDEMIVYAISSNDRTTKGVVVNAFGMYSSYRSSKLVQHLEKHHK